MNLVRTVSTAGKEIEPKQDVVPTVGRFARACMHALRLAICPENRKKFLEAVRIRTLRTQQRAISQCQKMAYLVVQIYFANFLMPSSK